MARLELELEVEIEVEIELELEHVLALAVMQVIVLGHVRCAAYWLAVHVVLAVLVAHVALAVLRYSQVPPITHSLCSSRLVISLAMPIHDRHIGPRSPRRSLTIVRASQAQ